MQLRTSKVTEILRTKKYILPIVIAVVLIILIAFFCRPRLSQYIRVGIEPGMTYEQVMAKFGDEDNYAINNGDSHLTIKSLIKKEFSYFGHKTDTLTIYLDKDKKVEGFLAKIDFNYSALTEPVEVEREIVSDLNKIGVCRSSSGDTHYGNYNYEIKGTQYRVVFYIYKNASSSTGCYMMITVRPLGDIS